MLLFLILAILGMRFGPVDLSNPDAPDVAQDVPIFPEDAALINRNIFGPWREHRPTHWRMR